MDYNNILYRCSSWGSVMTNDRSGTKMGETAKKALRKIWIKEKWGRSRSIDNKYVRKGNKGEEDGITILSIVKGKMYQKNKLRLTNDYLTGEPDLSDTNDIMVANETVDTKCSWDIDTFYNSIDSKLDPDYEWQGRGYMKLTGAKKHTVAFILINTPDDMILNELFKDSFKWDGNKAPLWATIEMVKQMIYDQKNFDRFLKENGFMPDEDDNEAIAIYQSFVEMPISERVHEKTIEHDEEKLKLGYARLDECRNYMNENF